VSFAVAENFIPEVVQQQIKPASSPAPAQISITAFSYDQFGSLGGEEFGPVFVLLLQFCFKFGISS